MSRRSLTISFASDHEVVGVEVAADVRVGEQPRVRRVARALEAVELEAPRRVDVAELVGEQDPPAGPGDARDLGHDELRPADVVEHAQAADEVEVPVRERKRLRVSQHERAPVRRVLARGGREVLLGGVDADDLADERRERVGERAGAAADVERALVTAERREQGLDPGLELGVALGLERAAVLDPVGHPTTSLVALPGAIRMPHASS